MLDRRVDDEAHCISGCDGLGTIGTLALNELVAADLLVSHILHRTVAVVVGRLPNVPARIGFDISKWIAEAIRRSQLVLTPTR